MSYKFFRLVVSLFLALAIAFAEFTPAATAPLPKVAVYAADIRTWINEVVTKLSDTGLYSQVDNLSPLGCGSDPTPTLATLQQYAAVIVWSDCVFNDPVSLGNVLADYIDGGGHVVVCATALSDIFNLSVGGRFSTEGYLPVTVQGLPIGGTQLFLVADIPDDPLLAGVNSFDGGTTSFHDEPISLTAGAVLVAHWTNGQPLVAYKGNVVALNFLPPSSDSFEGGWNVATDGVRLMTNALNFGINAVIEVDIEINPGKDQNRIEIEHEDDDDDGGGEKISVAILSTEQFNAIQQVDRSSLTFGSTGDESSLNLKGRKQAPDCKTKDVNKDKLPDLVCKFMLGSTAFQLGDTEGILKGLTVDGTPIEGRDSVVIKIDD